MGTSAATTVAVAAGRGGAASAAAADSAAIAAAATAAPGGGTTGRPSRAARSAAANAAASWYLSSGRLLSAFMATAAYGSLTPGASVRGLGGAAETCCTATATSFSPRNGSLPVSASNSTTPAL